MEGLWGRCGGVGEVIRRGFGMGRVMGVEEGNLERQWATGLLRSE